MTITHISFDVADGSFTKYTRLEWHNLIADAREQLQNELNYFDPDAADLEEAMHWSVDEVLEAVHGEEFFWEEL